MADPRPRTRRRQLHRWGARHASVLEGLHEALVAMTTSAAAVAGAGAGTPVAESTESTESAAVDAEYFLALVRAAQELPAVPDAGAQATLARALALWHEGGVLQRESLRPFDGEGSARAADTVARGVEEFTRFAQSFAPAVA